MRLTIVGTGYVGLVTGTCLADCGNHVCCLDIDESKVRSLRAGKCTIYEPGLEELMVQNATAGRLTFTTDLDAAVRHGKIIFICVGTPPSHDGSADLSGIEAAARAIAQRMTEGKVIVIKSTVPVGTGDRIEKLMRALTRHPVDLVSNPEFLKEGAAVSDFREPDRVVIGASNADATELVRQIYLPCMPSSTPIILISRRAAEMCKYAANSYLAMRISFINEMANICERANVDIDEMKLGMATDRRIGRHFLHPGVGYGGSCFPKDVQALASVAEKVGCEPMLLQSIHETNERQKHAMLHRVRDEFGGSLAGRRFAVWGVTFKARTDDIRESPALTIIDGLLESGAEVCAYDPQGLQNLREVYGEKLYYAGDENPASPSIAKSPDRQITKSPDAYAALAGCDALLVLTEWDEFRSPDF
ncbi:MAG TPA: UDP-glucose/GDP-mannose dehydrogenase family protein, partial [Phycisphaerae bacterium]|nr:UDP-glucose/GDP-mannose dehydrogenase family protein [Phycisphaerae bacterium]